MGLNDLGRSAHSGRGCRWFRLAAMPIFSCGTPRQRRHPADFGHHGPWRGRRGVFPGAGPISIFMAREPLSARSSLGPDVVKAVTHDEATQEELGGASVHAEKSERICHVAAADSEADVTLLPLSGKLLGYLPQNNMEDPALRQHRRRPAADGRRCAGQHHPRRRRKALRRRKKSSAGWWITANSFEILRKLRHEHRGWAMRGWVSA